MVGTYRSDELNRRHPFNKTLTSPPREAACHEIELNPLSLQDVERMLEAILEQPLPGGFVEAFYRQTGGNPFFVEELLKSIVGSGQLHKTIEAANRGRGLEMIDIPTSVADSVLMRCDTLAEDERLVLNCAVVIGRCFGFEMLRRLTGLEEERLLECLQRMISSQLVEEAEGEGDRHRFRHALTREAIYDAMVGRERRTAHEQVLAVLEDLNQGDLGRAADQLAYHSLMARDLEKGRSYARMAGKEATRKLAHREAIAHLETALELTDEEDIRAHAELLHELGMAAYPTGDTRLYSRYWEGAKALCRELGEGRESAQISLLLSRLASERGDRKESVVRAEEALAAYSEEEQSEEAALVYSVISQVHMLSSQTEEAIRWGQKALDLAIAAGSDIVQLQALNNLGVAYHERGDIEKGISLLEQGVQLAEGVEEGSEPKRVGGSLGGCLLIGGELHRARQALERTLQVVERSGFELHRGYMQANLGGVALEQGN